MRRRATTWWSAFLLPLLVGGLLCVTARAGGDGVEARAKAMAQRIDALAREAQELEAQGRQDEARALRAQVEALKHARKAMLAERDQVEKAERAQAEARARKEKHQDEGRRREAIVRGLSQGLEALRALGGQQDLIERLEELRAHLQRKPEPHAKDGHGEGVDRLAGPDQLAKRIEIMGLALHGLREAGKGDAAEILERAIRSGRVQLEQRQDAEARAFLEQTPPLHQLARVLHLAADVWMGFGHETKAHTVLGLAKHYARRAEAEAREEREEGEAEEHDGEEREGPEAEEHEAGERGGSRHEAEARAQKERAAREHTRAQEIDRLQQQMQAIHRALEAMGAHLQKLLQDR